MTEALRRMLNQALELSPQERAVMANCLLESLDDQAEELSPEEWQEAWSREIAFRIKQVDEGKERLIPWEEVERSLNATDEPEEN